MSQQRISTSLRTFSGQQPFNLIDRSDGLPGSKWTQGATLIDAIPIEPPLQEVWTVLAWTFTFAGGVFWGGNAQGPPFGKLGSLWAGLLPGGASPTQNQLVAAEPWANPMLPLPADLTTFVKVWDGSTDPVFPIISGSSQFPTIVSGSAEQNLPSPLAIRSGASLLFGLWLTPSLVQNAIVEIAEGALSLVYDDGKEAL